MLEKIVTIRFLCGLGFVATLVGGGITGNHEMFRASLMLGIGYLVSNDF